MNSTEIKYFNELRNKVKIASDVFKEDRFQGIWKSVIDKYPDAAHFIFELLQNADDAGASKVRIFLSENDLTLIHNGNVSFSITDPSLEKLDRENGKLGHINAITSIGFSTKSNDGGSLENKIGKFGVGFKSVFQHTNTPFIYDDNFQFKLTDYIVPELLEKDHSLRKKGETLFYLPFDKSEENKVESYTQIKRKLSDLIDPILFLQNLKEIEWQIDNQPLKTYKKETIENYIQNEISSELIRLNKGNKTQQLWLFTKQISVRNEGVHDISVGFYLNDKSEIDTNKKPPLFCFFPTKEKLNHCFVMHAPFVLVDNRQQIKENNQTNDFLFNQLSILATQSIILLREYGIKKNQFLINDNILDIIPLEKEIYFRPEPFYDNFLKLLKKESLFLSNNRYLNISQSVISSNQIQSLLTNRQLNSLLANSWLKNKQIDKVNYELIISSQPYGFILSKSKRLSDEKIEYLKELKILKLDINEFGELFTGEFIIEQDDEWILKFYKFLCDSRQLIEKYQLNYGDYTSGALKYKPIIKLENGLFESPYLDKDIQNVFIPEQQVSNQDYKYIKSDFLGYKEVKRLLEVLKIGTPNYESEILTQILPKYSLDEIDIDENVKDVCKIAYELKYNCNQDRFKFLLEEIQNAIWIRSINNLGEIQYSTVENIFYPNEKLKLFYGPIDQTYFVDIEFYLEKSQNNESIYFLFEHLNFQKDFKIYQIRYKGIENYPYPPLLGDFKDLEGVLIQYDNRSNSNIYVLNSLTIDDYSIDSIEIILKKQFNIDKSVLLWQFLSNNLSSKHFQLNFYYLPFGDSRYNLKSINNKWSQLAFLLKKEKWLYNKEGKLRSTKEITSDELHPRYDNISQNFLNLLGIKESTRINDERIIENIGSEELKKDLKLLKRFRELGVNFENLEKNPELIKKLTIISNIDIANKTRANSIDKKPKEIKIKELFTNDINLDSNKLNNKLNQNNFEIIEPQIDESQYRIRDLKNEVIGTEKYTYSWFEKLMELEYLQSNEDKNTAKPLKIYFSTMEKEPGSNRLVILKNPSRPIPLSIENQENIEILILYTNGTTDQLTFNCASVRDFSVRLKVSQDLEDKVNDLFISEKVISQIALTISNQVKILEKLKTAFRSLKYDPLFNMRLNLNPERLKFIFGPPGTGKTTYLSKEISTIINSQDECKILVLTPTNKAADVITSRLLEQNKNDDSWIWRFVTTNDPILEEEEVVYDRNSEVDRQNKVCVISTVARYPYDGFKAGKLKELEWDYIVIDEASMIPLIQIIYPIYNSKKSKIIIAGDPFQIDPIVLEDLWSGENIYQMINLLSFDAPKTIPYSFEIVNLTTQYRSIPSIGDLFSNYAYLGKLNNYRTHDLKRKIKLEKLNFSDINFITFPVNSNSTLFDARKLSNSNVHIYSALFTFEFVRYLNENLTLSSGEKPWSIGIICPYKSQAEMISKLWDNSKNINKNVNVTIGTIHGFQGDECDIILAVYNPPASGMIRNSNYVFINKQNIMNVAISRAKDSLFILMPDKDYLNFDSMYELLKVGAIASRDEKSTLTISSNKLEEIIFDNPNYIEENTFVTIHQMANVYSKSEFIYDIRIDDNSVDIQINS